MKKIIFTTLCCLALAFNSNAQMVQAWANEFDNPAAPGNYDQATDIVVDGSGNSYVTGTSYNYSGYDNIMTIKYDANGVQQWAAEYNNPDNQSDYGRSIALDNMGNVYVGGYSYRYSGYYNYTIIKYDGNGNQLWMNEFDGGYNDYDELTAITVDGSGNVYATGYSYQYNYGNYDYGTVKFDAAGNYQWSQMFNNPYYPYSYDYARAIAVDVNGNVLVTGNGYDQWSGSDGDDMLTCGYDANGNLQFYDSFDLMRDVYYGYNYWNTGDYGTDAAADANGNIFVTGHGYSVFGTGEDMITIKYNSGGRVTEDIYNDQYNQYDYGRSIAVSALGDVFVGGTIYDNTGGNNLGVVKYDNNLSKQWDANEDFSQNTDDGYSIAVDGNGNSFVTGQVYNNSQSWNFGTVVYDNNGTKTDKFQYDGTAGSDDYGRAIAVDVNGNAYVTGDVYGMSGGRDYATVKYCSAPANPGIITGPASVCQGQNAVAFSVPPIGNATGYNWVFPTGATIVGGANTNSILVDFGILAISGNVTVQGTSSCSNGAISANFPLIVNPLPTAAGTISGPASVCQGQTFVNFSVPVVSYANTYNWVLPAGASIIGGNNTNSIIVNFAANAASGNITVQATNACGNGAISSIFALTVNPTPAAAGAISGLNAACEGQTGVTYSVSNIANATGYNWVVPAGSVITAGANTNSITVTFGATSGNVTVSGTNACGNGTVSTYPVVVTPKVAAAGTIGGSATICQGQTNVSYFVNSIANAAGYNWVLPAGATIVGGANTNSILVNFSNSAVSGNITVAGTNNCGNGTLSTLALTVNPLPATAGAITGSATVCAGQTAVMYTVAAIANASGYNWTWPMGVTVSGGNNMDTIIVDYGAAAMSGTITVEGTNACGTGVWSSFAVLVNSPAPAASIMGPVAACAGQTGVMYSVTQIPNAIGYSWTLPVGATIAGGANTNVIWVDFAANAVSGNISVAGTNACGNGLSSSIAVTVNAAPVVTFSLAGKDSLCLDEWHQAGIPMAGGSPLGGSYSGLGIVNGFFYPALAGAGTHVLTYTYSNATGCSNSATASIYISTCTGISELLNSNNITVYPNPTKGSFTINATFAENENANIVLYNLFGESVMVIENGNVASTYTKQVNIDQLANGVYFLTIQTNGNTVTSKIIKN